MTVIQGWRDYFRTNTKHKNIIFLAQTTRMTASRFKPHDSIGGNPHVAHPRNWLTQKPAYSACFFSRNSIFLSQQINQNSVFQPSFSQPEQYFSLTTILRFSLAFLPQKLKRRYYYQLTTRGQRVSDRVRDLTHPGMRRPAQVYSYLLPLLLPKCANP